MDLNLSEEQIAYRKVVREFLKREAVPMRAIWDRMESVDLSVVPRMGDLGVLGLGIPEEYGGSGGDFFTYALTMEELGRADSSLRGLVSVSLGLVAKSILRHGSKSQKQRWLPDLSTGRALGCFALTEPGTGSDAGGLVTSAVRDGAGYRINGVKMFITNGTWAKVCLLFARTGGPGARNISALLVPMDSPGVQTSEIKGKLGLRGQATAQLTFDDVWVPDEALLGDEGSGFKIAMQTLDAGRVSVAAGSVGISQACLEDSVRYSLERYQFGRPIAEFQMVQDMIAEISTDTDASRLLVWQAVDLLQRGEPFAAAASKAKYFASEAAVRSANRAIQIFGGYGYIDEYPVQKYLRDARVTTLYEGTSQIQKLLIGRDETGVNALV